MWPAEHQRTAVTPGAVFFLTTLAALLVYWLTLAPDLIWAHFGVDGGELITAVFTRGLPHPPGYPLYRLLSRPFVYLPLGSVAYRFNLFSALTMALAGGFLALASYQTRLLPTPTESPSNLRWLTAVAVGLTFAYSSLVWSQATITEVYGLALLLLAAFLWSLLTQQRVWLTGLLLGLSLTAHLNAWFMLPLALALTPRRDWLPLLLALLVGLLPLALLPGLAAPDSPVVWGDPTTLSGWWWLVSGQLYRGYAFALPGAVLSARLAAWTPNLLSQLTWAGLPLIVAGLTLISRGERRAAYWLGGTAVFYIVFALGYLPDDAIVNTLPAWLLLSLLLGPAYHKLRLLALSLPLILLLINFSGQIYHADQQLRARAEALLPAIPTAAIVETPGDPTIFALWYFQYVEGQRPDLVFVDSELFFYDWYRERLAYLHPHLAGLDEPDLAAFQAANWGKRPYCQAVLAPSQEKPYTLVCPKEHTP